ncbi:MAG: N-acetylmuramoyl-L-alanine amidase family protein, partial [Clostridiales bacterium]|nr:N-acetylmuramoyl-L-alanine amidase family protein [Clostridiales bacterium]
GTWYHFNTEGYMNTGWQMVGNKWYLLNQEGAMATGWQLVNNKWYFLNANGDMVANTVIDGYRVDETGAWIE